MKNTCACITHPGLSHDEHMDRIVQTSNRELLNQAQSLIQERGGWSEYMRAEALLNRFAELERVRLDEKARWVTA